MFNYANNITAHLELVRTYNHILRQSLTQYLYCYDQPAITTTPQGIRNLLLKLPWDNPTALIKLLYKAHIPSNPLLDISASSVSSNLQYPLINVHQCISHNLLFTTIHDVIDNFKPSPFAEASTYDRVGTISPYSTIHLTHRLIPTTCDKYSELKRKFLWDKLASQISYYPTYNSPLSPHMITLRPSSPCNLYIIFALLHLNTQVIYPEHLILQTNDPLSPPFILLFLQ